MYARVTIDKVTIFAIRPPELLFIDKMEWYFKYFERCKEDLLPNGLTPKEKSIEAENLLHRSLDMCEWIDGMGHRIEMKKAAAKPILDILNREQCALKKQEAYCDSFWRHLKDICELCLDKSRSRVDEAKWKRYESLYISKDDKPLPVIVFSNVRPKNASKFVIHLLLSMGHFLTKADLWIHGNMRSAFEKARLVPILDGLDLSLIHI